MIKILHLTYDMRIGGTEMVIKNIIEGCDNKSFQMSIYCIEPTLGPWGQELKDRGLIVSSYARREGFDFTLIRTLRAYIRDNNIDIIHCHQYTPWVYGALASLMLNTKVIFTEHGRFYPDSTSWKRRLVNPILSILTDRITVIAKATRQSLVEYEFLREEHIKVVYNGIKEVNVDKSRYALLKDSMDMPINGHVIGTIARLDPIKNQTMLLRSFALVLKKIKNVTLLIIGDGEERERLEELAKELGVKEQVIFTGYKPNPYEYLKLMKLFLLPSFSEGTSMTLLESLSLGIPCVVTNVGGNPEIIEHNFTGLVTPTDEHEKFASAIIELLSNEELCFQFSMNAKNTFQSRFTQQIMQKQYSAIYQQLAEKAELRTH